MRWEMSTEPKKGYREFDVGSDLSSYDQKREMMLSTYDKVVSACFGVKDRILDGYSSLKSVPKGARVPIAYSLLMPLVNNTNGTNPNGTGSDGADNTELGTGYYFFVCGILIAFNAFFIGASIIADRGDKDE